MGDHRLLEVSRLFLVPLPAALSQPVPTCDSPPPQETLACPAQVLDGTCGEIWIVWGKDRPVRPDKRAQPCRTQLRRTRACEQTDRLPPPAPRQARQASPASAGAVDSTIQTASSREGRGLIDVQGRDKQKTARPCESSKGAISHPWQAWLMKEPLRPFPPPRALRHRLPPRSSTTSCGLYIKTINVYRWAQMAGDVSDAYRMAASS